MVGSNSMKEILGKLSCIADSAGEYVVAIHCEKILSGSNVYQNFFKVTRLSAYPLLHFQEEHAKKPSSFDFIKRIQHCEVGY